MNMRNKAELDLAQETMELVRCAARRTVDLSEILERLGQDVHPVASIAREARSAWGEVERIKLRLARMARGADSDNSTFAQVDEALPEITKDLIVNGRKK